MADTAPGTQALGVPAADEWDQPPRAAANPAAAPTLAIDGFEGPLDWLVQLAHTRRIDLARLSIAALIEAFNIAMVSALEVADGSPLTLARWSEWLVMATELALLRSRLLLRDDPARVRAAQDEAERLRQALLDRDAVARAADWLECRMQAGRDVFLRGHTAGEGPGRSPRTGDVTGLLRACLVALRLPANAAVVYAAPKPPFWSVSNALERIRNMLPTLDEAAQPLTALLPIVPADDPDREMRTRTAVTATLLAGLELAREGIITLTQQDAWKVIDVQQAPLADAFQV